MIIVNYRKTFFSLLGGFVIVLAASTILESGNVKTDNTNNLVASVAAVAPSTEGVLITILTMLYSVGGIINILGYVPTIKDLLHRKPSANISTYVMWILVGLLAFLYGLFVLKDLLYNVVMGAQLAVLIIVLTLLLRLKYDDN